MRVQRDWIIAIAIILSQWVGMWWLAMQLPSQSDESGRRESAEIRAQLERIEALQAARVMSVDPKANTVTMDQSILRDTLRQIVKGELAKVSPELSAEYAGKGQMPSYVGTEPKLPPDEAYARSQQVMQEAMQHGAWGPKQTADLLPLVNSLTSEQRIELLEQYHGALNRGEMKFGGVAPPL